MSDEPASNPPGGPQSYFQNFQHTPIGARVPEKIGRGVFCTAIMVLQTNDLFVIDFFLMMAQPQQVVARIVMTTHSYAQFIAALRVNIANYEGQFGPLQAAGNVGHRPRAEGTGPNPEGAPESGGGGVPAEGGAESGGSPHASMAGHPDSDGPPAIKELYEQLKFPEELVAGAFSNAVMIRHTREEFGFDFISNLFPRPTVVSRVYTAAGRIRTFLSAMAGSLERFQQGGGRPPPSPPDPGDPD